MKFSSYISWLNENINEGITVLLPGSFKPMHIGHVNMIRRYVENPKVKEVRIFIGSGVRNGITPVEAVQIALLLLEDLHNVSVEEVKVPVLAAYKFIEAAQPGVYAMGGSEKDTDYGRVTKFVKDHLETGKYYHLKHPDVKVIELPIDISPIRYEGRTDENEGEIISGTILRQDILNDDYGNFKTNYPGIRESIVETIWDMTKNVITESVNEKFTQESDPIHDLGIGNPLHAALYKLKQKFGGKIYIPKKEEFSIHKKSAYYKVKGVKYNIENIVGEYDDSSFRRFKYEIREDSSYWAYYCENEKCVYNKISRAIKENTQNIKESFTPRLFEGGNIFDGTGPIKREDIPPTMDRFTKKLNFIFPNVDFEFKLLGSAGKKDISGDIDLALSEDTIFENNEVKLDDWGISPEEFTEVYELKKKRARSASEKQLKLGSMVKIIVDKLIAKGLLADPKNSGAGTIFCCFPQYNEQGQKVGKDVQIDVNIGNMDWLTFSYHSESYEGNVKGLHRTQLIVALFANKKRTFRHGSGVYNSETTEYDATNPTEVIELLNKLYNFRDTLTRETLNNFYKLREFLVKNLSQSELYKIYDIYLKILDSTRTDIPTMLQEYWIKNQDRLGLQGKFLPEDSNLYKFRK